MSSLHSRDYSKFLEGLVAARHQSGMTQKELADKIGKPQSYIAKIEIGERRLDVLEFVELVEAMQLKPTKLLDKLLDC